MGPTGTITGMACLCSTATILGCLIFNSTSRKN